MKISALKKNEEFARIAIIAGGRYLHGFYFLF